MAAAVRRNETLRREADLLEEINGPARTYSENLAALRRLLDAGRISAEDFARVLRDQQIVLLESQRSFGSGVQRGLLQIQEEFTNFSNLSETAVTSAFLGMEDALVQFSRTGRLEFSDLVDSIVADLARISIREHITGPLAGRLGGLLGSPPAPGGDAISQAAAPPAMTALAAAQTAATPAMGALAASQAALVPVIVANTPVMTTLAAALAASSPALAGAGAQMVAAGVAMTGAAATMLAAANIASAGGGGLGGLLPGGATGGFVTGPGTSTSDSVLARLSSGEFVVNASSTRRFLPLLKSINQVPKFQQGGIVGSGPSSLGGDLNLEITVNNSSNVPLAVDAVQQKRTARGTRQLIVNVANDAAARGDLDQSFGSRNLQRRGVTT